MSRMIEQNFEYFLNNDFEGYKEGEWIAIYKEKIIAHGNELKKVLENAKKTAPATKVLLSKIKKTSRYL